ncbi:hypothetical protein [Phytohabitans aurantiacus]|uniref:Uncharacterized protein n=1 Tax=Phytohabitans aurantiacus TaxID=3016789 RepID=A0ABQ5R1L3_9ACTN|nr:hypothetical protein [Phytohabitans aurantiacus]GLI00679.1 hypothetical protein Pa4123_59550 [Phytohabitans aurantiacus]
MDARINSPWLSDWRGFADETDMAPKARRVVQEAIRQTEAQWAQSHEDAYRERFRHNRTTRNESIVDACEGMRARLKEIRSDLANGQMDPKEARAAIRDMDARYRQMIELHDTLIEEDAELETFATMTPDEWQRDRIGRFPALRSIQPSLSALVAKMDAPPPPGGSLGRISNPPPHTNDAPSPEDLTV